ncbi:hypothetical protein [Emticicia agri]|uniref:Porin n=1 Tax=Emticicia agri TaxID=2492393 RepID=A0A4Q5M105_9BACT|nr:hypothetical protein [Emticicia agri]RYU95858.1 hypothetical protein EWM59_09545 [Emticicia agri]
MAILTAIFTKTQAQTNTNSLESVYSYNRSKLGKVQFKFSSLAYVRNNEYFNNIADGYTLFGYYLNPKVAYQPHEKVSIELGGFARKEFGTAGFKEIQPTFTIQVKQNDWRFLFGNIEGNINHRMIEPLMSFERLVSAPLEHGAQIKYQKTTTLKNSNVSDEVFFDLWLDWQRSTSPGQTNQESFWNGLSFYSPALLVKGFKVKGLVQGSIYHAGGQNIQSALPVVTRVNTALGVRIQKDFLTNQSLVADNYYVGYYESPYRGTAYYLNGYWQHPKFQVGVSYWFGHFFYAPMGNDLFQSYSRKFNSQGYYEPYRSILILRLVKDWKIIDGLNISLRAEPHYDVQNGKFEHSEGLYVKYQLH